MLFDGKESLIMYVHVNMILHVPIIDKITIRMLIHLSHIEVFTIKWKYLSSWRQVGNDTRKGSITKYLYFKKFA